jgi:hypothetical protein
MIKELALVNQPHKNLLLGKLTVPHFSYDEYGVRGVGKNRYPIISLDPYIDHSQDDALHIECCKGLALCSEMKMGMVYGAIPPEEVAKLGATGCWTETLEKLDILDPTGVHKKAILEIIEESPNDIRLLNVYKYCYFALGSVIPWFYACYLKTNSFKTKTEDTGKWTENVTYFPNLVKYLETLPFKTIGRVLFFTTYPNAGVAIHRDSVVEEHSDHNINLFFGGGWRPSFVWDEKKKEKIYLEKGARSYFFNNRDYHGVDPEPNYRYTLRIDGTFTDEFCEKLGLENGYTWKWDYEK